jgi:hypothetical protein
MVTKKKFECDEAKALREGFAEAISKGKLFNVNTWKKKRENLRVKLKVKC